MITIPELVAQALGSFLTTETRGRFGTVQAGLADFLPYAARLAMECIGNSDALYHDIEHSMLVTLVGHDILIGRALQRQTTAGDYANFILACLTHDIGYVRGVVQGDQETSFVADVTGRRRCRSAHHKRQIELVPSSRRRRCRHGRRLGGGRREKDEDQSHRGQRLHGTTTVSPGWRTALPRRSVPDDRFL